MRLPLTYILDKIYQNTRRPIYKSYDNVHNFECPICNEGKSSGRKRRGFFILDKHKFFCHNCSRSWSPTSWVMEVCSMSFREVCEEAREYDDDLGTADHILSSNETKRVNENSLPKDCINLTSEVQVGYYKDNEVVQLALKYIEDRRLLTATNKSFTYYLSLVDDVHMNRLIIPFYDTNDKIVYYQSRSLGQQSRLPDVRYLSKKDCDRTLYGVEKITDVIDTIYIFEGPIDSNFTKNGVALCSLQMSHGQSTELGKFFMHEKVWVLDNEFDNKDVVKQYTKLIELGEKVVILPKQLSKYKDMNQLCVDNGFNGVTHKFLKKHTYTGLKAKLKLQTRLN